MQKFVTCLWFDNQAEEAAKFYTSIFKNSKIGFKTYYGEGMGKPKGMVLEVAFSLNGQEYLALNGGPEFKFSEAISIVVNCDTQAEIDELWRKLTEGGEESQCGWLKDKFGLSWQIVPTVLEEMMQSSNAAKTQSVMKAVLGMIKLDIAALKKAYDQG